MQANGELGMTARKGGYSGKTTYLRFKCKHTRPPVCHTLLTVQFQPTSLVHLGRTNGALRPDRALVGCRQKARCMPRIVRIFLPSCCTLNWSSTHHVPSALLVREGSFQRLGQEGPTVLQLLRINLLPRQISSQLTCT